MWSPPCSIRPALVQLASFHWRHSVNGATTASMSVLNRFPRPSGNFCTIALETEVARESKQKQLSLFSINSHCELFTPPNYRLPLLWCRCKEVFFIMKSLPICSPLSAHSDCGVCRFAMQLARSDHLRSCHVKGDESSAKLRLSICRYERLLNIDRMLIRG